MTRATVNLNKLQAVVNTMTDYSVQIDAMHTQYVNVMRKNYLNTSDAQEDFRACYEDAAGALEDALALAREALDALNSASKIWMRKLS